MMFVRLFEDWRKGEDAMAAVEASMIFPILLMMMMGIFDLGNGILANQKSIRASQIVADLIARENIVSADDLAEAIEAGRLAFEPMSTDGYGVDIVSMRFDEDAETEIVWQETRNMTAVPDPEAAVDALAEANEGIVMVTVQYQFSPLFTLGIVDDILMEEVAFSRGRRSAVVNLE